MPRKKCYRITSGDPDVTYYKPAGIPLRNMSEVILYLDEYEAIKLADYQNKYQEEAALQMGISRQTFGRIIDSARQKIADALIEGKAIRIEGLNPDIYENKHITNKNEHHENSHSYQKQKNR